MRKKKRQRKNKLEARTWNDVVSVRPKPFYLHDPKKKSITKNTNWFDLSEETKKKFSDCNRLFVCLFARKSKIGWSKECCYPKHDNLWRNPESDMRLAFRRSPLREASRRPMANKPRNLAVFSFLHHRWASKSHRRFQKEVLTFPNIHSHHQRFCL